MKIKNNSQRIHQFYKQYIVKHGVSAGWASIESAYEGYTSMATNILQYCPNMKSILDVGSGEGHFSDFLRDTHNFKGDYMGLELISIFHENALKKYGQDQNAMFVCSDFLEYNFDKVKFDWVCSLGSLSVKQDNQAAYDLTFCIKMASLSNNGFSVYLNDSKQMKPGRLEEVPDLAAHDIEEFVEMMRQQFLGAQVDVTHFPTPKSQGTIVTIHF